MSPRLQLNLVSPAPTMEAGAIRSNETHKSGYSSTEITELIIRVSCFLSSSG